MVEARRKTSATLELGFGPTKVVVRLRNLGGEQCRGDRWHCERVQGGEREVVARGGGEGGRRRLAAAAGAWWRHTELGGHAG